MIDNQKMKQLVAHIIRRDRGVRDIEYMQPMREWVIMILVTILVILIGAVFSTVYYYRVVALESEITVPPAPITPYDGGRVGQAIAVFAEREATFNQLQTGRVTLPVGTPTPLVEEVEEPESETEAITPTETADETEAPVALPVVEESAGAPTLAP